MFQDREDNESEASHAKECKKSSTTRKSKKKLRLQTRRKGSKVKKRRSERLKGSSKEIFYVESDIEDISYVESHIEDIYEKEEILRKFRKNTKWTPQEDKALFSAVRKNNGKNWKTIAKEVPNHTVAQCYQRWRKSDGKEVTKKNVNTLTRTWTPKQDAKLIELVKVHGNNWTLISERFTKKVGKQCRERWINHLDPNVNKSEWTKKEDLLLIKLQKEKGNRWVEIAKCMNGRSENDVKNRFYGASIKYQLLLDSQRSNRRSKRRLAGQDDADTNNDKKRAKIGGVKLVAQSDVGNKVRKHQGGGMRSSEDNSDEAENLSTESRAVVSTAEDIDSSAKKIEEESTKVPTRIKTKDSTKDITPNKTPRKRIFEQNLSQLKGFTSKLKIAIMEKVFQAKPLMQDEKYKQFAALKIDSIKVYEKLEMTEKEIKEKDSMLHAQNMEIEILKKQLAKKNEKNKRVQEMESLSKDLQEDLQCPICFNPMKDPCIVPECCHRFCYACIEDAIAKSGKECPICRARITSKRDLRRDELFGKIAEVVCCHNGEEEEDQSEKS